MFALLIKQAIFFSKILYGFTDGTRGLPIYKAGITYLQGASPNQFLLRSAQATGFVFACINLHTLFIALQCGWFALPLTLAVPALVLRWAIRKPTLSVVDDKNIFKIPVILTLVGVVGLLIIMPSVSAITSFFSFSLILLGQNVLRVPLNGTLLKYLSRLSFFGMLFGTLLDKVLFFTALVGIGLDFLKKQIVWVVKIFNIENAYVKRSLEYAREHGKFDFSCHVQKFQASLRAILSLKSEIIYSHVLDNNALMPPLYCGIDTHPEELLDIFDKIKWTEQDYRVIDNYRENDWRLKREGAEDKQNAHPNALLPADEIYQQDITYLRENLAYFVKKVSEKSIKSVKSGVGQKDMVERYAQGIIDVLKKLRQKLQHPHLNDHRRSEIRNQIVDTLVYLGFDTGQYCPIGILRASENAYRRLFLNKKDLGLKECVRFIHQMHREIFFQGHYVNDALYGEIPGFEWFSQINDTHPYARAVKIYAPRLGLPTDFADVDEGLPDLFAPLRLFMGELNSLEAEFWDRTSIASLKKQIRDAVNTPLLPIKILDKWYNDFIDAHTIGTPAEKAALKAQFAYTVEQIDGVIIYRLKEEVLNLILLDMGVIAISKRDIAPENYFHDDLAPVEPGAEETVVNTPSRTLRFADQQVDKPACSNDPGDHCYKQVASRL